MAITSLRFLPRLCNPNIIYNRHICRLSFDQSVAFSTNATKSLEDDPPPISNRAAFQALPVIPSILAHIEKIGVGIRSKPSLKRKRKSRALMKGKTAPSGDILNETEEAAFFADREREHSVRWRDQRSRLANSAFEKKKREIKQRSLGKKKLGPLKGKMPLEEPVGAYWLPPPPFSSFLKSDEHKQTAESLTDRKIVRRPVKCLGSAGSLKDKIPIESKGLSEIAICGRSNVGKSTLLNALLYGNTDESLAPRQFQRGRTPHGAKLPKGIKAMTSHKPGETKELTFYQITADVMMQSNAAAIGDDTEKISSGRKKKEKSISKMSLLLVDLPGYGFAFAKEERTKDWQELMHHYLLERRSLKRILLLLDARHGFKQTDYEFLGNLQDGLLKRNVEGKVRSFCNP